MVAAQYHTWVMGVLVCTVCVLVAHIPYVHTGTANKYK